MKPLAVLLLVLTTHIFAQYRRTTCSILLKSPLPANTRCGSFGTLTTPRNLRNSNILIATVDNCRDECLEDPVCLAFSVNAKKCQLYSASLATMGYKTASAGTRFYERNCYRQDCETLVTQDLTLSDPDDGILAIALPFPITMYGKTTTTAWMSANGVLSFTAPSPPAANNGELPDAALPDVSIAVFWEDMKIQPYNERTNGLEQGLSWEYRNDFDERTIRFYWKAAYPYNNPVNYVDVELWFYAGQTGPAFIFFNTIIGTGTGNLGSQCRSCGSSNNFRDSLLPGLTVAWNSNTQTWYNPLG